MTAGLAYALALVTDAVAAASGVAPGAAIHLHDGFTSAAPGIQDHAQWQRADLAAAELGWSETPSLRFGATRFAREGPWADASFTLASGRVIRLWLVDESEPDLLFGDRHRPEKLSLRWSLAGARR